MTEQWTHWEPIPGLAKKYYIDAVLDTQKNFTVILCEFDNAHNKVRMTFENFAASYRCADETYRTQLFIDLDNNYPDDFYANRTFFRVINSELLQWMSEQSCTISDYRELQHFSFLSANLVLDVVAGSEPKIEFFTAEKLLLP